MPEITTLPHILAAINSATVIVLLTGFIFIRKKAMVTALVLAVLFLAVYVTYHLNAGLAKFGGEGVIRPVYFTILILHVLGAIALTPMVPMLVWRAIKGRFEDHKRLAKWTWPLWMYVSVSGVVVYAMAIHLYPAHG